MRRLPRRRRVHQRQRAQGADRANGAHGDGQRPTAVYDEGFYNISIGRTLDDIANGANNPPAGRWRCRLAAAGRCSEFRN
jgi:hypothetical protein